MARGGLSDYRFAIAFDGERRFVTSVKNLLLIISIVFAPGLGVQNTLAQWSFADLAKTNTYSAKNQAQAFAVAFTNGASSQYFLKFSIATNGIISGRGTRYDIAASSSSPSPLNGKAVTIVSLHSKLGLPIKAVVQTDGPTMLRCPFSLKLSDGAIIKGVVERNVGIGWDDSDPSLEGVIIYKGATGSTLSLSNPY